MLKRMLEELDQAKVETGEKRFETPFPNVSVCECLCVCVCMCVCVCVRERDFQTLSLA